MAWLALSDKPDTTWLLGPAAMAKCVQHRWSDEIATPDHQEAQLLQKTSSQALSMPFATDQGLPTLSDVP